MILLKIYFEYNMCKCIFVQLLWILLDSNANIFFQNSSKTRCIVRFFFWCPSLTRVGRRRLDECDTLTRFLCHRLAFCAVDWFFVPSTRFLWLFNLENHYIFYLDNHLFYLIRANKCTKPLYPCDFHTKIVSPCIINLCKRIFWYFA